MTFPTAIPNLRTERLQLRALDGADVPALFAIYSDPEVMRYWSTPPMTVETQAERIVTSAEEGFERQDSLRWAIQPKDGGELIGSCTLFSLDTQNRRAEIGYILGRRHWGHGYMVEALTAVLDYGFSPDGLDLHRVEADLDPRNSGSERVLTRLGFQKEGLLRERWIVAGEVSDSLIMGLLRKDWQTSSP